jgi:hypothetical protein
MCHVTHGADKMAAFSTWIMLAVKMLGLLNVLSQITRETGFEHGRFGYNLNL